ncbi:Similar to Copia protein; acc. no. P04146 [Pyronema omphalodes CBS 100304]|uniref:Similar to Copia protein acc. no. P04146 n=1 Tax=Pyronema omphalodes (strain CBS 100304) TaxID=1076935 RepID=U4KUL0_PYROM|nr:Similar to Copia protein; acc. no. P04146 [Pyronema omphalodes CBS 100304]
MTFGGAFDWRSRKQKFTAQSTTDAEYYTFGSGCMRLAQLNHILAEIRILGLAKPLLLYDNKGCLDSIKHGKYRGTTVAHIATKYQLAVEMLSQGLITASWIPSNDNLADAMTKTLTKPTFTSLIGRMGLVGKSIGKDV